MNTKTVRELEALDAQLFRAEGTPLDPQMTEAIADLRVATAVLAARNYLPAAQAHRRGTQRRWFSLVAGSVAVAALAVSVSLRPHGAATQPVNAPETAAVSAPMNASPLSDESLMQAVQSDLSSSMPAAMEPLATTGTAGR